jgi:hypothetical protein
VKAVLTGIGLEPDPSTLPGSPEDFSFSVRILVGQTGTYGEESFDMVVCSPEWLAKRCQSEGFVLGLHHLVVRVEDYDERKLRAYIEHWVSRQEGSTWDEIAQQLRLLGHWEFEGY